MRQSKLFSYCRRVPLVFLVCAVLAKHCSLSDAAEPSRLGLNASWTLYHAIVTSNHEASFERRGSITLSIPDTGTTAVLEMENLDLSANTAVTEQLLDVTTPKLYQLKLVSDNDSSLPPIVTTVPACQVLRANLR
jgi:hypothetical protein